jgi:predicted ester cyclase
MRQRSLLALVVCIPGWVMAQPTAGDESLFRRNAPQFHRNFSAGQFQKNGALVTPDIEVDSNNVKLVGRDAFVQRIERYSVPFPGLQLRDRVILVDGNVAAVSYVLQGEHKGPYGALAATGRKIEAMSGEVFEFDPHGLMKKLTTITQLDRVQADIKGTRTVEAFEPVTLLANGKASPARRAQLRAAAARFDQNVNERQPARNAALAAPDVRVEASGRARTGAAALVELKGRLLTAFPDLQLHAEYVLADGNRAAVEYVMEGTQTGPYRAPDGQLVPPTGKKVRVRGIDFMAFDASGLLTELVMVHNEDDFVSQLRK